MLLLWLLAGAANLASAEDVSTTLRRPGNADLVVGGDPAAPVEKVRQVIADPRAYAKAMPALKRVDVIPTCERKSPPTMAMPRGRRSSEPVPPPLTLFAKNEKDNLSMAERNQLAVFVKELKKHFKR